MVKQIGQIDVNGIKKYQALPTDLEADYPTINDCAAGSEMTIIDETTKKVTGFKEFNGNVWAEI